MGRWMVYLVVLLSVFGPARSASLCTRCETAEILALKRYYGTLQVDAVTFRGFIANLLITMESMPSLAPLRAEIMDLIHRYDDCIRTCEIPFTKRSSSSNADDVLALDLWLGDSAEIDGAARSGTRSGDGRKSSPDVAGRRNKGMDFMMRRHGKRNEGAGESISILISPDFAANWIRERMNDSRQKSRR